VMEKGGKRGVEKEGRKVGDTGKVMEKGGKRGVERGMRIGDEMDDRGKRQSDGIGMEWD